MLLAMKATVVNRSWIANLRWAACVCLGLGAIVLSAPVSSAESSSSQTIAQGFKANSSSGIVAGAILSTAKSDGATVELTTPDSVGRIVGIADEDPLLAISTGKSETQVVLAGTTSVLVSDINGSIHSGDKIAASPIAGVGMLATADGRIVGTAQTSFTNKDGKSQTIKDSTGKSHTIRLGSIPIQVGVAYYQAPGSNFLPPFVQRLANSIAGRPVSLIRIVTSSLLLLVSLVGITVLIYVSTKSAMISLGRNPLAAHDIRKSLYQVIGIAGIAACVTLLGSYLILSV
jgi:hypothetical protein